MRQLSTGLILTSAALWSQTGLAAGNVTGLGDLPGVVFFSHAYAISGDASVAVGLSIGTSGTQAFRWTQAGGIQGIGDLAGGAFSSAAYGVNSDGAVIVGESSSANGTEAFRWTQAGGMLGLGDLAGGAFTSHANAVSADGSVVVGYGTTGAGTEAFRWTQGGGMVGLGNLPAGGLQSVAYGVSGDGSVVVGYGTSAAGSEAFRWTQAGGMVGLGHLAGAGVTDSLAFAISADGSTIVGCSANTQIVVAGSDLNSCSPGGAAHYGQAFRWTQAGGMVGLGYLGAASNSKALAVSGDGSVVVGFFTETNNTAFRWTQAGGMQAISTWLAAAGASMAGWSKTVATGVSNDGTVVTGYGRSAASGPFLDEAFIARVSPDATGIIGLTDLQNSLAGMASPMVQLEGLNSLALNGAHHRPLSELAVRGSNQCAWASTDLTQRQRSSAGNQGMVEAGACQSFDNQQWLLGIGIGQSQSDQEYPSRSWSRLRGQHILTELDWQVPDSWMLLALTGIYGEWTADTRRSYSAGATYSLGSTSLNSTSLRARLDWQDAFGLGPLRFTPSAQYSLTDTNANAYSETGGWAPARLAGQTHHAEETRLRLRASLNLDPASTLHASAEWAHRFDSQGATLTGSADVLGAVQLPFTFNGQPIVQDWARLGLDLDHRFTSKSQLSVSLQASSKEMDADWGLGLNWKHAF
jgi:probable HAF family extracellular repeat protein